MAQKQQCGRHHEGHAAPPTRPWGGCNPAGKQHHGQTRGEQIGEKAQRQIEIVAQQKGQSRHQAHAVIECIMQGRRGQHRHQYAKCHEQAAGGVYVHYLRERRHWNVHAEIGHHVPMRIVETLQGPATTDREQDMHAGEMIEVVAQARHMH